jgi:hypothetical protein
VPTSAGQSVYAQKMSKSRNWSPAGSLASKTHNPLMIGAARLTIILMAGQVNGRTMRADWTIFKKLTAKALLAIFAAATVVSPCHGALASSGEYQLEASVRDNGGGGVISGGEYSSAGAIGQPQSVSEKDMNASGPYVNRIGFYNPPHFTFQKGLASIVNFSYGAGSLILPPGAVDKEVFEITLNNNPAVQPLNVQPGLIDSANGKMERNEGAWSRVFPGQIAEIALFDEQDAWQKPFNQTGILAMPYKDNNADGILDGSSPPVRVDAMRPWRLDEAFAMWTKLPASSFNQGGRNISVSFLAPGVYALLGMVDDSVKDTYAFPVPFRPGGPNAGPGPGQTGTEAEGITFTNVPQIGRIEIYTPDGRLVKKLEIPAGLVLPKLKWDVRTAGGERAASGVYLWRAVSGSNSKTGKLMVIW